MGKVIETHIEKLEIEEESQVGVRTLPPVYDDKIVKEFIEDSQEFFNNKDLDMEYVGRIANELIFVKADDIIWREDK